MLRKIGLTVLLATIGTGLVAGTAAACEGDDGYRVEQRYDGYGNGYRVARGYEDDGAYRVDYRPSWWRRHQWWRFHHREPNRW